MHRALPFSDRYRAFSSLPASACPAAGVVCRPSLERATFPLPTDGSNLVGQLQVVTADARNTLLDIARHYDLGYDEITRANPGMSVWLPGEGTPVVVPTEFILPPRPWAVSS